MLAQPIKKLIDAFTRLPGVGPKTAERFTIFLLKSGRGEVVRLQQALEQLLQTVRSCVVCHNFTDTSPCEICVDQKRDRSVVCVVAEPQDVIAIEKIGSFAGVYHVLRGLIDPIQDTGTAHLKLSELLERVRGGTIREIIFALDPTIEGETTVQYIASQLKDSDVSLMRLATGIPSGGSIEYADEITLGGAFQARQKI